MDSASLLQCVYQDYKVTLVFIQFSFLSTKYRLVHCFEALPQKSALSGQQCAWVDFETRTATNWPTFRGGSGQRHRQSGHWPPETKSKVAGDRPACGVGRNLVCMSVSWSQFTLRNRARDVGLTVYCCAGVSRNCALTCLVNDTIRNGKYFRFLWYNWWRVGFSHNSSEMVYINKYDVSR